MGTKGIIDWDALCELVYGPTKFDDKPPREFWEPHAAMYDQMSRMEEGFTQGLLDVMNLQPTDTVLDIGCGTGRLAVPIAQRVARVTGVDASSGMLARAMAFAEKRGVENLSTVHGDWRDPSVRHAIGKADLVISSRTEILWKPELLTQAATRRVYLSNFAEGPSLREVQLSLFEGIPGSPPITSHECRQLGYNIAFNRCYDAGYSPNLVLVPCGFRAKYPDRDAAYADLSRLSPSGEVPSSHTATFHANVDRWLHQHEDNSVEFFRGHTSYVMWWDVTPSSYATN